MNRDLSLQDQLAERCDATAACLLDARNIARQLDDKDLAQALNKAAYFFVAIAEVVEKHVYKPPTPDKGQI